MNDFLTANKKYLALLIAGVFLLAVPYLWNGTDKATNIDEEQRFKQVIENAEGVGKVEIMTSKTKDGSISGVVIVAQGAEHLSIKKEITDAASAAFGVQPHKIQVFSYKQEVVKK